MAGRQVTLTDVLDRGLVDLSPPGPPGGQDSDVAALLPALKETARRGRDDPQQAELARKVERLGTRSPARTVAVAMIDARHKALGGDGGFLGAATGPVTLSPVRRGFFREFKNGSIYWHPATGAHEVHGEIRGKWRSLGAETGFLGYPLSDETVGADLSAAGRFNRFEAGSIYWHPSTGAREVHGAIHEKYLEVGAERSFLGYPTTDETATPDGTGRFNHFQGGSIYWTPSTWAHEVHGPIRELWASLGWERNPALGYPVSDELIPDRRLGAAPPRRPIEPDPGLPPGATGLPDSALTPGMSEPGSIGIDVGDLFGRSPSGPSRNRFGDFENGVLFWRRGTDKAVQLTPSGGSTGRVKLRLTAAEVVAAASVPVLEALGGIAGATVQISLSGVTGYWHDGASTHNRRHRLLVAVRGSRPGSSFPIPIAVQVEVLLEAAYEPVRRQIVGFLTEWTQFFLSSSPSASLDRELHAALDPVLWRAFPLLDIPERRGSALLTVLSAKTSPGGDVEIYVEP